jgi:hypothetical protein
LDEIVEQAKELSNGRTPTKGLIDSARLDHVAVAVHKWSDAWPLYIDTLGGEWRSGGLSQGFAPAQLAFKNEMRVEVLMPSDTKVNDFLARFLDKHGPGPHHMTFKVHDLAAALEILKEKGFNPTGVSLANPWWKELFLYPKEACGIVVQLAQASGSWFMPAPEGVPSPKKGLESSLIWIGHVTGDLEKSLSFFSGILNGNISGQGKMFDCNYIELKWPGPGCIRLIEASTSQMKEFLENREGKVHHLAFSTNTELPDLTEGEGGYFYLSRFENLGVKIIVQRKN